MAVDSGGDRVGSGELKVYMGEVFGCKSLFTLIVQKREKEFHQWIYFLKSLIAQLGSLFPFLILTRFPKFQSYGSSRALIILILHLLILNFEK